MKLKNDKVYKTDIAMKRLNINVANNKLFFSQSYALI